MVYYEYSPYDEVQDSYFEIVAFFLSLLLGKEITSQVVVDSEEYRTVHFQDKNENTIALVVHDVARDGSHTKPWTLINNNEIGREPIWGIDEIANDEEATYIVDNIIPMLKDENEREIRILDGAEKHLDIHNNFIRGMNNTEWKNQILDVMIENVKKRSENPEFIEGARDYADGIYLHMVFNR